MNSTLRRSQGCDDLLSSMTMFCDNRFPSRISYRLRNRVSMLHVGVQARLSFPSLTGHYQIRRHGVE